MTGWSLRVAAVVLLAPFFGGCASVVAFRGITLREPALYVSGVPPLVQDGNHSCGPVSVAAVASHWGIGQDAFLRACPSRPGETSGRDLQELAAALGLRCYLLRGGLDELRANLAKGRPVIVMLPKPPDPAWRRGGLVGAIVHGASEHLRRPPHWVVVVGLAADGSVVLQDPASGPIKVAGASFAKWWEEADNLCLLIVGRT